jgi:hypothetical protein
VVLAAVRVQPQQHRIDTQAADAAVATKIPVDTAQGYGPNASRIYGTGVKWP